MKVGVVGLGHIGLPLAVQIASRHQVMGADINGDVVRQVNAGTVPFPGEEDLQDRLTEVTKAGRLTATISTTDVARACDVVVVIVPVGMNDAPTYQQDRSPDFRALDTATHEIAKGLRRDTLVVFETTVPVGTTRQRCVPMLEMSGLEEGVDFHVAFSPERVFVGRVLSDLRDYPKLVGGLSDEGTARAVEFYQSFLDHTLCSAPGRVWPMECAEAAELAKLAETTFRNVNIALANGFALHAVNLGLTSRDVFAACNSQPFSHIHRPGLVGGHCIPVYPQLYLWGNPDDLLVLRACRVNESMPTVIADLAEKAYPSLRTAHVAVLGAAFRGDVKEATRSGVFPLVDALLARSASVSVHDPLFTETELSQMNLVPHRLGSLVDVVVVQADHSTYRRLQNDDLPGVKVIVDIRNVINVSAFPGVKILSL